jgi:hypothetical protein
MKVQGKEVPQDCIDKMLERMKAGPFKATDLSQFCRNYGICDIRAPENMIRNQKYHRNIQLQAGKWHWVRK